MVLLSGLLFDFQALVYFLVVFHLMSLLPFNFTNHKNYQRILKVFFSIGLGFILLLNTIDTEFYKIKTRRSGIELFTMATDPANSVGQYIINYWWMLLALLSLIFLMVYFYPRLKHPQNYQKPGLTALITLLFSGILFLGARGGLYVKPIRSFDAARFVSAQWVSAVINSPTQLLTSYSASSPFQLTYFGDDVAEQIFNPVYEVKPYFKKDQKPNIVLIILESFGRDYVGFMNHGPRFTPFLDSLSKQSVTFSNAYSSGTTSMESIPAIFASVPSLLEVPFINSNFQNNTLHGLHYYLDKKGYDCSFYYGAANGSMGFDNFLKISGPISYLGLNEYPSKVSDHDGSWGIWDEPYLQYFNEELGKKKGPFFSSVFTLTSHDPYKIPKQYEARFKGGHLPIYRAVQYTDYALSMFFEKARQQPWFGNTIFIITADHASHSTNEYFYTPIGKYEIPLMIYSPRYFKKSFSDSTTVSHCDIMPTILSFAGCNQKIFSFGKNVFDSAYATVINHDNGITQLIHYPYCIQMLPNNKVLMQYQPKYGLKDIIRYKMSAEEKILQQNMEMQLKAKKQIYINRLIENKFFRD